MAAVVDARRDLVDQERAISAHEQLHRQHAHIVQRIGDLLGDRLGLVGLGLVSRAGTIERRRI